MQVDARSSGRQQRHRWPASRAHHAHNNGRAWRGSTLQRQRHSQTVRGIGDLRVPPGGAALHALRCVSAEHPRIGAGRPATPACRSSRSAAWNIPGRRRRSETSRADREGGGERPPAALRLTHRDNRPTGCARIRPARQRTRHRGCGSARSPIGVSAATSSTSGDQRRSRACVAPHLPLPRTRAALIGNGATRQPAAISLASAPSPSSGHMDLDGPVATIATLQNAVLAWITAAVIRVGPQSLSTGSPVRQTSVRNAYSSRRMNSSRRVSGGIGSSTRIWIVPGRL